MAADREGIAGTAMIGILRLFFSGLLNEEEELER
jgi:hypothetical protein